MSELQQLMLMPELQQLMLVSELQQLILLQTSICYLHDRLKRYVANELKVESGFK